LIESTGKTGKPRKLFQCAACGLQFSATSNTLFHDSHLPLTKWFAALSLMVEAKKGISANQVARHIGMTYKTAWYVCHRIREAMQEAKDFKVGSATTTVEIDEMFVGGKQRLSGKKAIQGKTAVLGLAERDGQIHMEVMKSVSLGFMRDAIGEHLDKDTKKVVTDGKPLYKGVIPRVKHERTNHRDELKHRNWTSTYTVESAFSLFKRGIVGNYHKLSVEHLDRYLGEFCWRYNRRRMQPWLFEYALINMLNHKPMPYKMLTDDGF